MVKGTSVCQLDWNHIRKEISHRAIGICISFEANLVGPTCKDKAKVIYLARKEVVECFVDANLMWQFQLHSEHQ